MPVKNHMELFVKMLSDVRQRTEQTTKIYEELSKAAQDPNIKEALDSRIFIQDKILARWIGASSSSVRSPFRLVDAGKRVSSRSSA